MIFTIIIKFFIKKSSFCQTNLISYNVFSKKFIKDKNYSCPRKRGNEELKSIYFFIQFVYIVFKLNIKFVYNYNNFIFLHVRFCCCLIFVLALELMVASINFKDPLKNTAFIKLLKVNIENKFYKRILS